MTRAISGRTVSSICFSRSQMFLLSQASQQSKRWVEGGACSLQRMRAATTIATTQTCDATGQVLVKLLSGSGSPSCLPSATSPAAAPTSLFTLEHCRRILLSLRRSSVGRSSSFCSNQANTHLKSCAAVVNFSASRQMLFERHVSLAERADGTLRLAALGPTRRSLNR